MIWEIFIIGAVIYLLFLLWYVNWRGPLKPHEVEEVMNRYNDTLVNKHTESEVLRAFLEADDGKEFIMTNFVALYSDDVPDPVSGDMASPLDLIMRYFRPISKELILRAGHPVYQAERVGGDIDAWGDIGDMDFPAIALLRYRSRRDFVAIMLDERFKDVHPYKLAALERTVSLPSQIRFSLYLRPIFSLPVVLLLICCLLQIGLTQF